METNLVFHMVWFTVSHSQDRDLEFVARELSHVIVWKQYVNLTQFFVRNLKRMDLKEKIWQYFTVVPDFRSTGIKDGKRAFEWSCIVRAVCSIDVMTATVAEIPHELMVHITERITHEVPGINRVLYDFTPKPTGTVEFE